MAKGVYKRKRYAKNYNQEEILDWLKNGKGNLLDYQKKFKSDLNENSIFAWMEWQPEEFKKECRSYHVKKGNGHNMPEYIDAETKNRVRLIQNQKMWRQTLKEVVTLPVGGVNEVFIRN